LGPALLDEASEAQMRARLSGRILRDLKGDGKLPTGLTEPLVEVTREDVDRVKVQLRALHLIDKGAKKRPISDKNSYWRLTEYGDEQLVALMAIRSDALDGTSDGTREAPAEK
jgi:hypothetical protein